MTADIHQGMPSGLPSAAEPCALSYSVRWMTEEKGAARQSDINLVLQWHHIDVIMAAWIFLSTRMTSAVS